MDFIGQLWLPILLATVFCFMASAVFWMLAPHHKKDWKGAPSEDRLQAALRDGNAEAGAYMFPWVDRANKEAAAEGMKKWEAGPSGILYVYPRGRMGMGPMLVQQFLFFLFVNFMLAYIGHHAGLDGKQYLRVFQVIGAVGFLCYTVGPTPESIWFGRPWRHWLSNGFDGLVYALLSAGTFGWLWPR